MTVNLVNLCCTIEFMVMENIVEYFHNSAFVFPQVLKFTEEECRTEEYSISCCSKMIGRGGERKGSMSPFIFVGLSISTKVACPFSIFLYDNSMCLIPHSHSDHMHLTLSAIREEREKQISEKKTPSNGILLRSSLTLTDSILAPLRLKMES